MNWGEEQARKLSEAENRTRIQAEQEAHIAKIKTESAGPYLREVGDHIMRLCAEFNSAQGEDLLVAQRSGFYVSVSTTRYPGGRFQFDYHPQKACAGVRKEKLLHAFSKSSDSTFYELYFDVGANDTLLLDGKNAETLAKSLLEFLVNAMIRNAA